ncbi:MAG: glycosyltransferase, partial [Gammaproteobacteria bacterium]|nr:glycosyltransferase [Gammaproteobacteria bacterium]
GIVIGAQSAIDAERFRGLGANPARTHVTGNIKFDFELAPEVAARGRAWRAEQAALRPVWIGASTHQDEEQVLIEAHRQVLERRPDTLLVLVPRHPERFAAVAVLLQRSGLRSIRRSSSERCSPDTQVFLGDSMGELTMLYAGADVAFVGGSLVPIGGHNLLEPAALGLPSLTGRYNFNAPDIAELLTAEGATIVVQDASHIAAEILRLLDDPAERARRGALARELLANNRGAVDRLLALVEPLIDKRPGEPYGSFQPGRAG